MSTYTVRIEPLGTDVQCRADQTVLDACLREGVWLPHACTHGTCGTCKARVLDGALDYGDASPYALLESERLDGAALLCTARPRGDLVVEAEVDVEEGIEVHPVRDYAGTVALVEDVAPNVRRLLVDLDRPMAFNAGQYVLLQVPPAGVQRSYSVASPPSEPSRLELHVKRTPGGVCSDGWVFGGMSVGDPVALSGPYGRFVYRPVSDKPMLLLAAGTGLAPIKSIIRHVVESGIERQMVLYHGVPTLADLYDADFFLELESELETFSYRPALSRDQWEGRSGRVPQLLAEDYPRALGHVAYVCGSPAMVEDTLRALMKARLFPRDISREDFYDEADKAAGVTRVRSPLLRR